MIQTTGTTAVRPAANHLRICAALLAMMANATKQSPTRQSYALVFDWLDRMAKGEAVMVERAELSVDGNAGCALLGEDLQVGEAEFVVVEPRGGEPLHEAEIRACYQALKNLRSRLAKPLLSYAWYPRRPGSAGA